MLRIRFDCAMAIHRIGLGLIVVVAGIAALGCSSDDSLAGMGLEVKPPATWHPIDPKTRTVPGKALAAWSGPQNSTLVVYTTLPIPGGTPESLARSLANRLTNLAGIEIKVERVDKVDNRQAARVELVGPGTGDALAPSSIDRPMPPPGKTLIPTRELILGLNGPDETLFLAWNLPESARDQILPEIEETVSKLRLPPAGKTAKSTY